MRKENAAKMRKTRDMVILTLGLIFICFFLPVIGVVLQGVATWFNSILIKDIFNFGGITLEILLFLFLIAIILILFRNEGWREKIGERIKIFWFSIEDYVKPVVIFIITTGITIKLFVWLCKLQPPFSLGLFIGIGFLGLSFDFLLWLLFMWLSKDWRWLRLILGLTALAIIGTIAYLIILYSSTFNDYFILLSIAAFGGVLNLILAIALVSSWVIKGGE